MGSYPESMPTLYEQAGGEQAGGAPAIQEREDA